MANRQKIMIADNNENIAEQISLYLESERCYKTMIAQDGPEALKLFGVFHPDLILLDIALPGLDGYQVCRQIREQSRIPIILLSTSSDVFDSVLGLELGADDFVKKPFDVKELSARIKAVLRRTDPEYLRQTSHTDRQAIGQKLVRLPDLIVNLSNYTVICRGISLDMPPKEIELLYFLASSPNQVFTREQLLNHIWGYDYAGDTRTVDVHIMRLRDKLGSSPYWSIGTVWGVGYRFTVS